MPFFPGAIFSGAIFSGAIFFGAIFSYTPPKEIHEDMVVTLGENAHSHRMVKKWDAEFKRGRDSLVYMKKCHSITIIG